MCSYSEISGLVDLVLFNSLCTVLWVYLYNSFISETGATDVYETITSFKDSQEGIKSVQTKHLNNVSYQ